MVMEGAGWETLPVDWDHAMDHLGAALGCGKAGEKPRAGQLGVSGTFRHLKSHKLDNPQGGGSGGSLGRKIRCLASKDTERTWTLVV
jgi:hypothetical protein